jgi:hypothetical protein
MRLHEILTENQILSEEILTELDWSKIKKGLATGAITLGALGISGNAMAQHFKVDNASKISDTKVVNYVQDKVSTGEIKPTVIKQAVQKVDAAPEVKKDDPKKAALNAAPEIKPNVPEPKQDIKPEVKKDEPKKIEKPKMSNREAAIEYGTKTAGTMHDLQKLGYSRAQAITELEKFTGKSAGMKQILTIVANMAYSAPKGHYTRSEFVNQVKLSMEENLPR